MNIERLKPKKVQCIAKNLEKNYKLKQNNDYK